MPLCSKVEYYSMRDGAHNNRKTGIKATTPREYASEYYHRFRSRRALEGETYVDGRTNRGRDWVSDLRVQMKKSARNRGIPVSPELTTEWLHGQFRRQRGRCFYTGIRFVMGERQFRGMRQASIDRVDHKVGYAPGNVVWCLTAINYAKNDYGADEFALLLEEIRTHRP